MQPKAKSPIFLWNGASKGINTTLGVAKLLAYTHKLNVGQDSAVGIATSYGLDGPGIEFWWGQDFPHPSRPTLGNTQHPLQRVPGLSRG